MTSASTIPEPIPRSVPSQRGELWRKFRALTLAGLIAGLALTNLLSLVNDGFHTAAYAFVKTIAASAIVDAVAQRLLSRPLLQGSAMEKQQAALSRIKDENASLDRRAKAAEKAHADLKADTRKKNARVAQISKKIAARSAKNAVRNLASIAGESIPYIGTAVILAVTAADLKDACDTMTELRQVDEIVESPPADQKRVCGMRVPSQSEVIADVTRNSLAAYSAAVRVLNEGVERLLPASPPTITWADIRDPVCAVIGSPALVCSP